MTTERNVSPPWSIGRIENLFTKFLEFFNADDSNRFRDGFAPLVVDGFSVLKFFKWHRTGWLAFRHCDASILSQPFEGGHFRTWYVAMRFLAVQLFAAIAMALASEGESLRQENHSRSALANRRSCTRSRDARPEGT